MKKKYLFMFLALFIMVISISCTFAEDADGAVVGTTNMEQTGNSGSITLDEISEANVENSIVITGKVTDESGTALGDSDVNLNITSRAYGDEEYLPVASESVKTDNEGVYSYSYMPTTGGQLNITATNNAIQGFANTSIFVEPKSTIVTINTSKSINIGESFNITGRLTDNDGNALRYTSIGVLVRGTPYGDENYSQFSKEYTKTDEEGYYTYIYTPNLSGRFDISTYYPGYHLYRFNRTDLSVRVIPKSTKVIINPVDDINLTESVTINGTLTDGDNNPLRYTSVGIILDYDYDNKTYVRTDENGFYSYNYTPKYLGYHDICVYYPGYHNYAFSQSWMWFYDGKETLLALNPIQNISYGESIEVSGRLTYEENNPLRYTSIYFEYDSENNWDDTYLRTDDNGYFSYVFKPENVGNYSFYLSFSGTDIYNYADNYTTVTVFGKETKITLNPIGTIKYGEKATVSGRLTDEDNNPISNATIYISTSYTYDDVLTDNDGKYSYTFKPSANGTAYVRYEGYQIYYPSSTYKKYVVYYDLNDFANMSIDKSLIKYYNPVLRFSTQWYSPGDFADIDSYCFEPNNTVCPDFPEADTGVVLFNDYVGNSNPVATEHIIYISKNLMTPGTYTFKVRDCDGWSSNNGFISEIEFDNKTYSYEYKQKIGYNKFVEVAKVTLSDGEFTISHTLPVTVKT